MAVFSQYSRVIEPSGSPMSVRSALSMINGLLDETLAEQEGDFDGETRWAVTWFEQVGMNPGDYGMADALSKAKNSALSGLVDAGVIESRGGHVRLLGRDELSINWNPGPHRRPSVWEVTQHLVRSLEEGGEEEAARELKVVGRNGSSARDLAYRLYSVCERKGWAKEAFAYNALVVAWPEIARPAAKENAGQSTLSL